MVDVFLDKLNRRYHFDSLPGNELSHFKAAGMKFQVRAFTVEKLGHVSVMTASGMLGLMKMDSLIVNPFSLDAPLFSYDRIHAMGRDVLYAEMYDTMIGKTFRTQGMLAVTEKFGSRLDVKPKPNWYDDLIVPPYVSKKGKGKNKAEFDQLIGELFDAYLSALAEADPCDPEEKKKKSAVYTEGLLENGGPATDPVKAAIGREKAERLFRELLFGTGL